MTAQVVEPHEIRCFLFNNPSFPTMTPRLSNSPCRTLRTRSRPLPPPRYLFTLPSPSISTHNLNDNFNRIFNRRRRITFNANYPLSHVASCSHPHHRIVLTYQEVRVEELRYTSSALKTSHRNSIVRGVFFLAPTCRCPIECIW